ncbi:MAG: KH domain-containing protein [Coriobacteriales bacterium]|jgi:spoIIIJ-associated protein|nr:KH domain-containing protein [Coriobacteriales bacterium]
MSFEENLDETINNGVEETDEQYAEEALEEEAVENLDDEAAEEGQEEAQDESTYSKSPALTDEELDQVADTAIETLWSILGFFDAKDASVDEYEGEEGELILDVVGGDLAVLIGRYGKTLDALQFLVASIVNKKIGFRYPIIVDIEGYRHRRRQKLETLAKSSAARCIRSRSDVRLRPMTPYERRIIHIILRNEKRVVTESEGEEPNRCIVVKLNQR